MSKNLFVFVLSVLTGVLLAACGSGQPVTPAESISSSSQPSSMQSSSEQSSAAETMKEEASSVSSEISSDGMVSFAKDVLPILRQRCLNCHGGQRTEKGLKVNSYEDLMAGSENGPVITPGDPANSTFVDLVQRQKMPKRGTKLTPEEVQLFSDWVTQGAPNN